MVNVVGIMADLHCHNWSQFSTFDEETGNSRLNHILREVERCARAVHEAGGSELVIAGDVFHVRGHVAPSVINPVIETLHGVQMRYGTSITILAGNHDLERRNADELTSAISILRNDGITIINEPRTEYIGYQWVAFIPWIQDIEEFKQAALELVSEEVRVIFAHVGLDGTIKGMPAHGIDPTWFTDNFPNVAHTFCGHYHNHKSFDDRVWSIGAPAHHNWGDVGSRPGWLLLDMDSGKVKFHASDAPRFIEITDEMNESDLPFIVDGHYVSAKIGEASSAQIAEWREALTSMGAKGVIIQATPKSRTTSAGRITHGVSLIDTVGKYCEAKSLDAASTQAALDILKEVTK